MKLKYIGMARFFKSSFYISCIIWIFIYFSACIKEGEQECYAFMHIKAIDALGNDITDIGQTGDVVLYIFDRKQQFIEQKTIPSLDIENKTPVRLSFYSSGNFWVVAWSNLNGSQQVDILQKGMTMQDALVRLKRDGLGYAQNPDDLFYGLTNILPGDIGESKDLIISRKNALVNIMVRGLDSSPDSQYYFVIRGANKDTYNFAGQLRGGSIEYKQNGKFDSQLPLFTSGPFSIFSLPENDGLSILIYKGQELISIADTSEGKPIVPMVGVTNNVLIDIRASLNVGIKITEWNITYHWVEW